MPWANFAVALGIGLLIGLERERSKGEGAGRHLAGIRTFAIAALLGAAAFSLGGAVLAGAAMIAIAIVVGVENSSREQADPGITTEVALMTVIALGGLAVSEPALAAGLAAIVAVILAAKTSVHRFSKQILTEAELNDGLTLAIAALTVWPLLPDRFMGPLDALNPHLLWLVVVIIMAIGGAGHVATRLLGDRLGLAVSGLVSGFVSSSATIGAMGANAARDAAGRDASVAGAALSTVATYVQMAVLLFAVSLPTFWGLLPAIAAGGTVAVVYGTAFTLAALRAPKSAIGSPGRAFGIPAALFFAAMLAVVFIAAAALQTFLGEAGAILGAVVAGLADAHAAALSIASRVASGEIGVQAGAVPILAGLTANGATKVVLAIGSGSSGFAARVVPGIVLSIGTCWAVWLLTSA